ncbi:transcriptional regulator, SARP family protein [Streptacidiphilus pinicola]|uniref:Transcriptional regulator, SARP family protein n=1 Tax=Streptacidiphilus pinicola TaxID=2219663 RepID=A0A2X0IE12_9ACTN|nr:helix-turn-helix domain-containing protein [Streptacidiphilus pinicola]RAG81661.1 transcriptional regulator, SARP family protein [Streptacidiphilus pinicola]
MVAGGFGALLREQRVSMGWSQDELAERSGVSARSIVSLETGRRRPRLSSVVQLADALGVDVGTRSQWLKAARDTPPATPRTPAVGPAPAAAPPPAVGPAPAGPVVPQQLPAAVRHFTGRVRELKELDALLTEQARGGGAVVISAIGGTAGVGKTSLAVHFAHRVAHRFPDGQLFADLRGFDPDSPALDAARVARGFLDALGVPAPRIPADPDGQLALYRSRLAGTSTLIVLDNAREAEQVRPLLPGSDSCLVLVTSRNRLPGLVALDGAVPLALDVLPREEALELLARRLGPEPVMAQTEAAEELIELCARLPLALNIAAARAADHPGTPLGVWADELRGAGARLDLLSAGNDHADVRAVLSWSYRALDPQAARLFRLLGLHPGPHIRPAAAAALAGLPPQRTRRLLESLHHAHLLAAPDRDRYTFHDLLRAYAVEQLADHDSAQEQSEATLRMLDHYLHTTHHAGSLAYADDSAWQPLDPEPPAAGVTPQALTDRGQALAWYRDEQPVLQSITVRAHQAGFDDHAWRLAGTQMPYLLKSGLWQQWQEVGEIALAAAERTADLARQAHAHRWLGQVHRSQGRQPEAHRELRRAYELFSTLGDRTRQGRTQLDIAIAHGEQQAYADALAEGRRALELFEEIDDLSGQALSLNTVGWYLTFLGRPREALPYCRRALELSRRAGNLPAQASIWHSIGFVHHHLGEYQEALAAYPESLSLRRTLGDYFLQAEVHTHIGDSQHALGDTEAARRSWTESLAILERLQHRDADAVRARLENQAGPRE